MVRQATDRLKCNPKLGVLPVLQYCRPADLRVDPAYQRQLQTDASQKLVRRIAQHWNWDLCQPLVVARRVDLTERLFVIDGQHRLEAARLRGDVEQLPCVVVTHASVADEAAAFVHLNQQRKPLSRMDLFKAAVASEDRVSLEITAALDAAGLRLTAKADAKTWKLGEINNIGGLQAAWRKHGNAVGARALAALAEGFAGQVLTYAGTIFPGIVAVCADEMLGPDGQREAFGGARWDRFTVMLAMRQQDDWRGRIVREKGESGDNFATASATVMRAAWAAALPQVAPVPVPARVVAKPLAPIESVRPVTPAAAPKPPVGMAALAPRWCDQCDRKVSAQQAAACASPFCKAKGSSASSAGLPGGAGA